MDKTNLFDHRDYRDFLASQLPAKGPGRGGRSGLAEYLHCELSFVSLVLNKRAHFSAEHAYATGEFLNMTPGELEYFLLLHSATRAGSSKVRSFFEQKINLQLKKRMEIRERVRVEQTMGLEQQLEYYSHWAYTAVHMCLLNARLNTAQAIASYLDISLAQTKKILHFFVTNGLAENGDKGYRSGSVRMHIPADSPLVARHHANWRLRALDSLSNPKTDDLRYSLVLSVSRKDADRVKALILDMIQKTEPILKESGDEAVYSMSLDFYEVGK
ncbi:MAG TPA: hypothetical protein DCS07_13655 [Bdellovibrionales bacterium]|nr:MAG: hypothetical protein A2Z97_11665 [Bdellovibrionales bacterium GWB1_52_6]OFZ05380.1 MAG: hypothetical protein A2X97_16685 [Bdellovibrionales bacterium GWA1_52_35]OFZ43078.1 MAG: hypothetical protein A2070_01595 [Bdellovibrionales bacterium GWC1_52_8]HAR43654.1 hypothetical protein [Bdellovibrionales bacterium]HCM38976.1 hypothetical protein [Bdellovibrionales bacterium]